MRSTLDSVEKFMTGRQDELVDFVCDLISVPSVNPPGDERAVAEMIIEKALHLDLEHPQVLAKDPMRPNLIFRVPGGDPHGPTLLLNGHMDTKPAGVLSEWETDPFAPVIKEGRLYGLGSSDMKGSVAAMLFATAALSTFAEHLRGELVLALTADEEAGGAFGAQYLAEQGLVEADVCLIGESSGILEEWEYICPISRGESCFVITVYGTQMHSSISDTLSSVNASTRMAEVLLRLEKELKINVPDHPLCHQGITVTPGVMVSGGTYYGLLPGSAEFATEIRVIPGMTKEHVRTSVEDFVSKLRAEDQSLRIEWRFEKEPLDWIEPVEIDADHPFISDLEWAAQRVLGFVPTPAAFPAWTDGRFFSSLAGIPTIPAFGPGLLPQAHTPNESIAVPSLLQAGKIYALAGFQFLSRT
jgi:acetylornithine deacetylase/succinyl-diaminopimelate desuccinylase family protein